MGKVNVSDLSSILCAKHGIDRKTAQKFISNMVSIIHDAIEKDRYLKIKGLGVFKIVEVDTRESVNVNTGERLTIDGHSKLAFIPDAAMRELVNRPFSLFETVVLNEGVDFSDMTGMDEQSEEDNMLEEPLTEKEDVIDDFLEEPIEEFIDEPNEEVAKEPIEEVTEEANEEITDEFSGTSQEELMVEANDEPIDEPIEEPTEEVTDEPTDEPIDEFSGTSQEELIVEANDEDSDQETVSLEHVSAETPSYNEEERDEENVNTDDEEEETKGRSSRALLWVLVLVALLGAGVATYFFLYSQDTSELPVMPVVVGPEALPDTTATDTVCVATPPDEVAERDWQYYDTLDNRLHTGAYAIVGLDHTIKTRKGDTTNRIAMREAGSEHFACYVEVFNGISASTELEEGTELNIPKLVRKRALRNPEQD